MAVTVDSDRMRLRDLDTHRRLRRRRAAAARGVGRGLRRRRAAIAVRRRGEDRRHPDRRRGRRRPPRRLRLLGARPAPRPHRAVVAPARRRAGGARPGARPAAQAGAARARAGARHRPGRVDLRSAAGRQRAPERAPPGLRRRDLSRRRLRASTSPLHGGVPTDRFIASWHVALAARRAPPRSRAPSSPATPASGQAPHVLRTREAGAFRAPHGEPDLSRDEPRLRVEIPGRLRADAGRGAGPGAGLAARGAARVPHLLRARLPRRRRRRRARRRAAVLSAGRPASRRRSRAALTDAPSLAIAAARALGGRERVRRAASAGMPIVEWPAYQPALPLQYIARSATIAAGTAPGVMASLTTSVENGRFLRAAYSHGITVRRRPAPTMTVSLKTLPSESRKSRRTRASTAAGLASSRYGS